MNKVHICCLIISYSISSLKLNFEFVRLLAREGINAEQLARDLKSFELKVINPYAFICLLFYSQFEI